MSTRSKSRFTDEINHISSVMQDLNQGLAFPLSAAIQTTMPTGTHMTNTRLKSSQTSPLFRHCGCYSLVCPASALPPVFAGWLIVGALAPPVHHLGGL